VSEHCCKEAEERLRFINGRYTWYTDMHFSNGAIVHHAVIRTVNECPNCRKVFYVH